ncbi:MAG: DUF998 domain-containing protein [Chloroflexota bacterium]
MMESTTRRIAYITGFVGAIIISLGSLLAGWKYQDADGGAFSIFNHFVSELGHTVNSQWALMFNGALVIGSLCLGIHLYCLALNFEGTFRQRLRLIALVGSLFGVLVGFFPMNVSLIHYTAAAIFFLALTLYIGAFTVYLWRTPENPFHRALLVVGIAMLVSVVIFMINGTVSFLQGNLLIMQAASERPGFTFTTTSEWVALAALIVWVLLTSGHLLNAKNLS